MLFGNSKSVQPGATQCNRVQRGATECAKGQSEPKCARMHQIAPICTVREPTCRTNPMPHHVRAGCEHASMRTFGSTRASLRPRPQHRTDAFGEELVAGFVEVDPVLHEELLA